MSDSIQDALLERAQALSAQDGAAFGTLQIVAATNQLQAELLAARDRLIAVGRAPTARAAPVPSDVSGAEAGPVPADTADDADAGSRQPAAKRPRDIPDALEGAAA